VPSGYSLGPGQAVRVSVYPGGGPDQQDILAPGMIPLTIAEIARLLSQPGPPGHAAYWLGWRRRHQARARWHHQCTRLSTEAR
jgi:hypothetical protein